MRVARFTTRSAIPACALVGTLGACGGAPPSDLLGPGAGGGDDAGADGGGESQDVSRDSGAPETGRVELDGDQASNEDASKGQEGGMSRSEAGACDPQKCSGCCDANGNCAFASDSTCGPSGAACTDCAALGQTCTILGACSGAPSCGTQSCMGCCQGRMCMAGTGIMACGTGGKPCQTCRALCLGSICL